MKVVYVQVTVSVRTVLRRLNKGSWKNRAPVTILFYRITVQKEDSSLKLDFCQVIHRFRLEKEMAPQDKVLFLSFLLNNESW